MQLSTTKSILIIVVSQNPHKTQETNNEVHGSTRKQNVFRLKFLH